MDGQSLNRLCATGQPHNHVNFARKSNNKRQIFIEFAVKRGVSAVRLNAYADWNAQTKSPRRAC